MASVREKLAQLGRPLRKLTVTVGGESVEVWYQRPTILKDRILREAMREEYDEAIKTFTTPREEDGKSLRDDYMAQLRVVGKEKTVEFIISLDIATYTDAAQKQIEIPRPDEDADEDAKKAWFEEWKPAFDAILESAREELGKEDFETLIERGADGQLERLGRERAFNIYRLRLILDSLFEQEGTKKSPVFESIEEIEESLGSEAIEALGKMIAEEVQRAREVPLASVAKTSP